MGEQSCREHQVYGREGVLGPRGEEHEHERCLTRVALDGRVRFLAANLYARSVFGEDALVNVSVEKDKDEKLGGYIRIRSKTQGIS